MIDLIVITDTDKCHAYHVYCVFLTFIFTKRQNAVG